MSRCRFNLDMNVFGLDNNKYDTFKLGDNYAKITDIFEYDGNQRITLESKHKSKDFVMVIETIWNLPRERVTFKIEKVVIELSIFGMTQEIYSIPESHMNTLKKWFKKQRR